MIKLRTLGGTGLEVSELGFGALEIGRDWAPDVNADPSHPDENKAACVLNGSRWISVSTSSIRLRPIGAAKSSLGAPSDTGAGTTFWRPRWASTADRNGSYYNYSADATTRFH